MNLLAIDYGTKKSGIATGTAWFAFAWWTVPTSKLVSTVQKIIHEKRIEKIIIGMPYNIDGSMSEHGRRVQKFWDRLSEEIGLPFEYSDERLSTSEARIGFLEAHVDGDIDAESARLILEHYYEGISTAVEW